MSFSATEAAFEGFRIARRHPVAIAIWSGVTLVFNVLVALALVGMAGPQLMALEAGAAAGEPDPQQIMDMFSVLAPAYLLMLVLSVGYYAVMLPAVERSVFEEGSDRRGFLALGKVELRHLGMLLALGAALFCAYMVVAIVVSLIFALVGMAAGPVVAALIAVALGLAAIVLMLWIVARFSLAGPAALREGGIGLSRSWALSKGRSWPLLGGLIISYLLAAVVSLLIVTIFAGVAALVGGMAAVGGVFSPDTSSLGAYFTPAMLGYIVAVAISSALSFAIVAGFGASAYRQLVGANG
jgi:hypothetical protein